MISTAIVPTTSSSRYLQQLCKHWSHKLKVDYSAERGSVVFPKNIRGADHPADATVTFTADQETLMIEVDASSTDQLETLRRAVADHLDRFAFREAPLTFVWS